MADIGDHPLLIVRGPSGSGKTTLLAGWAMRQRGPGVWVTLGPSAQRRVAFWQKVLATIVDAELAPKGSPLRETVVSVDVTASLREVLLRGFNTLPEAITLVLDDYQEVTDAQVHEDIHWLLRGGARMRVVIGTRVASVFEEPGWTARLDTGVIVASELVLTRSEIESAARALEVSPTVAEEILPAFSGLALPTRAALIELALGRAATVDDAIARVRQAGGFVLDHRDVAYEAFLLRCSVARQLTSALARELGGPDADEFLVRAERDGLGTWSTQTIPEFVFNPYIRRQLEGAFGARLPDQVRPTRIAYGKDRAEHGDPLEAARQYAAVGDLGQIVKLARRFFGDLIHTHFDELVELLRASDQAELRRHPELLAMLLLQTNVDAGAPRLRLLHLASLAITGARVRLGRGDPVDRLSLLLSILSAQRVGGHYEPAVATAAQLASTLAVLDGPSQEAVAGLLPYAWIHTATTYFYTGDLARADEYFRVGLSVAKARERPWSVVHASSMQILVSATAGDMATARPALQRARARSRPHGWQGTYPAAGHHLGEAYLALEQFDGVTARAQLAELASHEPTIEHWPLIAKLRALAALVDGTPHVGLTTLARDIAAHSNRPPMSRSVATDLAATRIDLLIADGQSHRASTAGPRSDRRYPNTHLARARFELFTGGFHRAVRAAVPLAWSDTEGPRTRAEAMIIAAVASHRLDNHTDAIDTLQRALDILDAYQLRRPLIGVPRSDLQHLLGRIGIDPIGFLSDVPDVFPEPTDDWTLTPAQLRILVELERTGHIDKVAEALHLSPNTVKSHLTRIYRKLGAGSRAEALATARIRGIL